MGGKFQLSGGGFTPWTTRERGSGPSACKRGSRTRLVRAVAPQRRMGRLRPAQRNDQWSTSTATRSSRRWQHRLTWFIEPAVRAAPATCAQRPLEDQRCGHDVDGGRVGRYNLLRAWHVAAVRKHQEERGLLLACRPSMSEPRGCSRAGRKLAGLQLAGLGEAGLWPPGTGPHARGAAVHDMWRGNSVSRAVVCVCVHLGRVFDV